MLYLLLSLLILVPTLSGIGQFTSQKFPLWQGLGAFLVLGILSVSVVWTGLAFFIPLGSVVEVFTIILGIFFFIYYKQHQQFILFFKENGTVFFPILGIIIFFGSFSPFILDHFGYYVPSILWIREIGLVKGISNLDIILGQMSVWHIFQAGFSNIVDPFFRINSLLMVVYLVYIIEKKSYLHILFFPILFLFLQSPSPDLPVIIFSLILVNEILSKNPHLASLFLTACFIFMIKPTALWVIILTCLYGFLHLKEWKLRWIWAGGILVILFCFKNIWLFGYPIFPMAVADLQVDWKPNALLMQDSAQIAIQKTYDMQYSYEEIQQFGFWDYIKNWLFLEGIKSKIHILFIFSLLSFGIFSIIAKNKIINIIFISLIIKSILVLSFSAQYRFFLEVFFVILFIIFYNRLNKHLIFVGFFGLSLGTALIISYPKWLQKQIPSFSVGHFMRGIKKNQWLKPSEYQLNKYTTHQIGNLRFHLTDDYPLMFDTPPPTLSAGHLKGYLELGIFPQWDLSSPQKGFRWVKLSHSEKEKLRIIIDSRKKKYNKK